MDVRDRPPSRMARQFFVVSVIALSAAASLAALLIRLCPAPPPRPLLPVLPPAFVISTLLLVAVSGFLERALWCVRRERQRAFRRALTAALCAGAAFTSCQAWGLSWLRIGTDPTDESAGVNQFVFLFAALHAVHVCVAILFLVFVTVQAFSDRYDHEYHWGVRFCAWFWHVLGTVWMVILGVFGLAAGFLRG